MTAGSGYDPRYTPPYGHATARHTDALQRRSAARGEGLTPAAPPIARSILWRPPGAQVSGPGMSDGAIFITQDAIREIGRHVWSAPEDETLGFLLGDRCVSPETGARFVLIKATTRSSFAMGDEAEGRRIPEDAWHASYMEARRRRMSLVGWYHSAAAVGDAPEPRDLWSHRTSFPAGWEVGLVVAPRAERPAGGFFRSGGDAERGGAWLPFFEVAGDDAVLPDGRKRTVMPWQNYQTDEPTERSTQVAVVRPRLTDGPTPILIPKGHREEERPGRARDAEPRPAPRDTPAYVPRVTPHQPLARPQQPGSPRPYQTAVAARERRKRIAIVAATFTALALAAAAALLLR